MRILFMADVPPNPDSGAAGTEYQTVLALRGFGHQVDTVWKDDLRHHIRHGNLHYLFELPFSYRESMLEHLKLQAYDVVHTNQPHGYLAARAVTGKSSSPVFVHRSHGLEPRVRDALRPWQARYPSKRSPFKRAATKLMEALLEINNRGIARYASGHIVSASLCSDFFNQRYGVLCERIAVIPQAPPKVFQETPISSFDARRLNRILYVGQFAFVKAPVILAVAFEHILSLHPQATLTWVCSSQHHMEAARLLSAEARTRVTFLDWVPQDQLLDIYDDHGVFLFPSFFEGFGKAFIEAMARGLVVIASKEGGAKDIIEHGRNGLLVPVGDAAAMATECAGVISNFSMSQSISFQARQTALQYTWDRVASETVDFYHRLIEMDRLSS